MTDAISNVVAAFRSSPSSGDAEIYGTLIAQGLERETAARLVEFLPMAYCRLFLERSGIRFSHTFRRRQRNGTMSAEQLISSEPVWDKVLAFARDEVKRGVSRNDLLAVAGRSAEFDAVNQMLNKGSNPKDIILAPAILIWPEDGPGQ